MNREQMIEKVADVIAWEEVPPTIFIDRTHLELRMDEAEAKAIAGLVLDAILPQVTTVEELEALPVRTLLLAVFESGEVATPWWDGDGRGGPVRLWSHDGHAVNAEALLDMCPLTVVWQP